VSEKDNIKVAERWIEALNAHDASQLEKLAGPGYVFDAPVFPGPVGADQHTVFSHTLFDAFSDFHIERKQTIAQGDLVVDNITVTGTHDGPLNMPDGQTIPPTGKKVMFPVSNTFQVKNGKVAHLSIYYDQMGMMAQLGLAPGA
jgi:steroid delta-isomerase-like uncharacterized protein